MFVLGNTLALDILININPADGLLPDGTITWTNVVLLSTEPQGTTKSKCNYFLLRKHIWKYILQDIDHFAHCNMYRRHNWAVLIEGDVNWNDQNISGVDVCLKLSLVTATSGVRFGVKSNALP